MRWAGPVEVKLVLLNTATCKFSHCGIDKGLLNLPSTHNMNNILKNIFCLLLYVQSYLLAGSLIWKF